jgi:hypothetical protein
MATDDDEGGLGLDDTIDLAAMESFPASDPPPWPSTHAGAPSPQPEQGPRMLHDVAQQLRDDVYALSATFGERNDRSPRAAANLERAGHMIEWRFRELGLAVRRRPTGSQAALANIEAIIPGSRSAPESIVVGAHYDTAHRSPGADDNASGVAALLALAHSLRERSLGRTVRLVAFAAEEAPHKRRRSMGSVRYVGDLLRTGHDVTAMISLEMLGLFRSELPLPKRLRSLAPFRADVLAMIGGLRSRRLVRRAKVAFDHAHAGIGVWAASLPLFLPGVRSSDHWAFARRGIPAIMLTDTGPLRTWRYHRPSDTPERLDYDRLARATTAISAVVTELAA